TSPDSGHNRGAGRRSPHHDVVSPGQLLAFGMLHCIGTQRSDQRARGCPARADGAASSTCEGVAMRTMMKRRAMPSRWIMAGIAGTVISGLACTNQHDAAGAQHPASGEVAGVTPQRLASTNGFQSPESIVYDSANDRFYVSNLNG